MRSRVRRGVHRRPGELRPSSRPPPCWSRHPQHSAELRQGWVADRAAEPHLCKAACFLCILPLRRNASKRNVLDARAWGSLTMARSSCMEDRPSSSTFCTSCAPAILLMFMVHNDVRRKARAERYLNAPPHPKTSIFEVCARYPTTTQRKKITRDDVVYVS